MIGTLLALLSATAAPGDAPPRCTLAMMEANLEAANEVPTNERNIYEAPDPKTHYMSQEIRISCTMADLLVLGFEVRASQRFGPRDSTNSAYETVTLLQRGPLLAHCYSEFALTDTTANARIAWSRATCHQGVQPRLRPMRPPMPAPAQN